MWSCASRLFLHRASLYLIVVAAACLGASEAAAADPIPQINTYGTWTLKRLGYEDQVIRTSGKARAWGWDTVGRWSGRYMLPGDAAQGRDGWYLLRIHYRLTLDPGSGDGLVRIFGSTNGRTTAMIDFEVNREDDAVEVTRLGLSLVNGSFRETARRTVWEGKYTNFLQNAGVRPGENELKVYFMERGDAVVEEMRVLSDSAIVYQPGGMAALRLTPSLSDRDIRVGERFRVDYELRNTGGTTLAAGGEVWVTPLAEGLCVVGSDTKKLGKIAAGKTIRGSFLLRAERPGSLPFELEASSFGGYPIASLAANVTGQPISGDDEPCTTQGASGPLSSDEAGIRKEPLLVAAGALGVVGVLAVVAIALRRWSRATSNASST